MSEGRPDDYHVKSVYSSDYSLQQLRKFLLRRSMHWNVRIASVLDPLAQLDLPGKKVLDLGTSIGTFAVELSQRGFDATGLDADPKAIEVARKMAAIYGYDVNYVVADASESDTFEDSSFDCIVAADIVEHLHDDILAKALANCYRWLKPGGYLILHTSPTLYHYIFHERRFWIPLAPFAWLSDRRFTALVRFYHENVLDRLRKAKTGKTYAETITHSTHCNLMTRQGLQARLEAAGFWVLSAKTNMLFTHERKSFRARLFGRREVFHRHLTAICWRSPMEMERGAMPK